jgi:hypothetical protein
MAGIDSELDECLIGAEWTRPVFKLQELLTILKATIYP